MQIEERVHELVEEKIADRTDLFIVRIKMHNSGLLEILMDGDNGIAIEDCVQISRHVGFHLEEEDAIDRAYRLEVSSPGIDTPLLLNRQYQKNIGRSIRIKGVEGEKREGKLIAVNDKSIVIEEVKKEKGKKATTEEAEIPLDNITETKVLISFK
ncbi:ribosome assembly cofactor RimP [Sphingobacterium phlebotomi]|uniref:Ribosome maturation factor RimP n=1 Tax=Sphingobacterium phlebotomi TaxID=2605433 RepID=A0A5D4H882_9SPHI|nr:ribosome assembly cofactor RimP [Sphingobacterium phlebotomi]TYR36492.1 ribosome assembly cofactor RimP [Sphingobacterium phlebotomi]